MATKKKTAPPARKPRARKGQAGMYHRTKHAFQLNPLAGTCVRCGNAEDNRLHDQ